MKFLMLLCVALSAFCFGDCTSGNLGVYDSKGVLVSSHAQTYKALEVGINLAQKDGKATIRIPDIVCTAKISSSSSISSAASVSSRSSSIAVSSSSCASTPITPFYRINGGYWVQDSSFNIPAGTVVDFAPQPLTGGSWSWSGCGVTGNARETSLIASTTCILTAKHINACGGQSTHQFYVNVSGTQASSSSSSSSVSSASARVVGVRWGHPTQRESGKPLLLSEIGGYEIRQVVGQSYRYDRIAGNQVTRWQLTHYGGRIEIAVYDTDGLYSRFVEVN